MIFSKDISIIIPTYKRPEDITRALSSVITQNTQHYSFEIIVADNDPLGSAHDAVHSLINSHPETAIIYTHVPEPGVSNARNGALTLANGRFIVFLDDDMEATADWAFELTAASERLGCAIVFGPIEAIMPTDSNALYPFMKPLFSRQPDFETGLIEEVFGTGGSLIDRANCTLPSPAFDPAFNEVGGEDVAMFESLLAQSVTVGWAAKALTFEHVPKHRSTADYVWKRNFAFGQGPSQHEADKGLSGALGVIKWMCVGVIQTGLYAPQYLLRRLLNQPSYIQSYAQLSQAVGKVLWFDGFTPRLYGVKAARS